MPTSPSTETEEWHGQYHETHLRFQLVSLSSVKYPLVIKSLSQYTTINWIIFMFLIPNSSKKP